MLGVITGKKAITNEYSLSLLSINNLRPNTMSRVNKVSKMIYYYCGVLYLLFAWWLDDMYGDRNYYLICMNEWI